MAKAIAICYNTPEVKAMSVFRKLGELECEDFEVIIGKVESILKESQ